MKKLLFIIATVLVLNACDNSSTNNNEMQVDSEELTSIAIEKAKAIYYSLPTPIETAMVLENTKSDFYSDFLLPVEKADFYETTDKKALILGMYTADLSYSAMFGQAQIAINYLSTTKNLIQSLGLITIISDSVMQTIQNNIDDHEKLLNLISEQYLNVNSYLDENNQNKTSALLILGGYVESLYIALNLEESEENNKDLKQIIYDQHITLNDLIDLLTLYKDDKNIKEYITELQKLKTIYSKIKPLPKKEDCADIKTQVELIRNKLLEK